VASSLRTPDPDLLNNASLIRTRIG
jgi:hypothetical protein